LISMCNQPVDEAATATAGRYPMHIGALW
jgi:hypothetical protein